MNYLCHRSIGLVCAGTGLALSPLVHLTAAENASVQAQGKHALAVTLRWERVRATPGDPKVKQPDGPAAGQIKRVTLLDRDVPQKIIDKQVRIKEYPGRRVGNENRYVWDRLPPGVYDLLIETAAGKFEGVDFALPGRTPLTGRDRGKIQALFDGMKTWADKRRLLELRGHGESAVALVELLRTKKTSLQASEPFVVWRVERWQYRKLYGVWRRERSATVLRRFKVSVREFRTWSWNFLPALGGIVIEPDKDGDESKRERTVTLPARFTERWGRAGSALRERIAR